MTGKANENIVRQPSLVMTHWQVPMATAWAYNHDGRPVAIIKHTGASMGYDRNNRRQHGTSDEMLNALIERIKRNRELHHVPGGQENNERDDADDDAEKQEGDTKRVPIVDINAASTAEELIATRAYHQDAG